MSWACVTLSPVEVATGALERRRDEFLAAFAAAGAPRAMGLFQQARSDSGLELFLTPGCRQHAASLVEGWGCLPCGRPSTVGLEFFAGCRELVCFMP